MTAAQPPEGGSFPRRPQRTAPGAPQPPQVAPKANGAAAVLPLHLARDPAQRRLLAAIEEYAAARDAAGLPPAVYGQPVDPAGLTPEQRASEAWAAAYITEIDAAAAGPFPDALPELAAPEDPDAFLVEGFIRPGTTVMLTGPPGKGKSWAARQLAMECAAGLHTFLGTYAISRALNVLVVDEDNGANEEWRRDEVLLATLGLQRAQLGRLRRLSLAGVELDQERWQRWLRGQIRLYEIDLVILDPVSEMHGGKELREDPAFRSMLNFLKRLKVDFPRLATLLVHHTRKAMPGDRSAERGLDDVRGQWGQTPDVVALMWGLGERRVAWELHKRVPHSKLILEASEAGPLSFVADETTASARQMSTDDRVLASLEAGATRADEIVTATGLSQAGVYKALKRLAQAGLVTARQPYQLVEEREIAGVEGD